MSAKPSSARSSIITTAAILTLAALPAVTQAAVWVPTAAGTFSWNSGPNWDTNPTIPNAIGAVANLGIDIAGAQTINLNAAITVGSLSYGDLSGNSGVQAIANGTGGSLTFNNGGSGATLTMVNTANANPGNVAASITLNDNLTVTNNSTATDRNNAPNFSGKFTGTGRITLDKGLFWLSNTTSDYTGGLTLNGSTAKIVTGSNAAAFGTGTFTVTSLGGTLDTSFNGAATQPLTTNNANNFSGTLTVSTTSNSGGWTNNGAVTLGSNFTLIANNGAIVSLNGDISDGASSFSLTRSGGNSTTTLNLNGTNTYDGGTNINAGAVRFGKLVSMPATGTVTMAASTALLVNAGGAGEWTNGTSGAGTIGGLLAGVGGQGNAVTWTGASVLGIDTSNAGGSLAYNGTIANVGTGLGIRKLGSGTLALNATNSTYTAPTNIAAGVLEAVVLANGGAASSIGQSTNTSANLLIGGGATLRYTGAGGSTNRAFQLTGAANSNGIIDASGTGPIVFTNTAAVTNSTNNAAYFLRLTGTNTGDNTLAANMGNNGTGARNLTKQGSGRWVLTGASTYTGATSVQDGTLLVNGSLGNTAVTVTATGAFGGTGTVGGTLDITSGSLYIVDLADPLTVTGTVSLYSGFGVDDLAGITWGSVLDGTYTLIDGPLGSGVFASLSNNSMGTAYDIGGGRSAYFQEGSLQLVVVPEPTTLGLLAMGVAGLMRRRRVA